jgi:hypothetical protein
VARSSIRHILVGCWSKKDKLVLNKITKIQAKMVGPARFELATSALSERRNNQSMPRALRFSLPRGLDKNVMTGC